MIILDTDIIIEIYDKKSAYGESSLRKIEESGDNFYTTAINTQEVLYGLPKYAKQAEYILQIPTLEYNREDAKLAAELEWRTETKGKKIARVDAMIAAITINNNAKLYTNNRKHFSNIADLELF